MENEGEGRTLLYVEDDAIIAMARAAALKRRGYAVRTAATGEAAVAGGRDAGVDLVLMDIDLGSGMDGAEAARIILAERDLPLIFLSSHNEAEVVDRTRAITSYGYVMKSAGDAVLAASIGMAFRLHEAHASLRRKEEELRLSEAKYATAFRTSPDAININRLADGLYLDINEGFSRIMGYERADVIGKSSLPGELGIWVRAEDRAALVAALRSRGECIALEAQFRRKDGVVIDGTMTAKVIVIDGTPCILSVSREVTEEKRVRTALEASERRFKNLFEMAPDLVLLGDGAGTILAANASAPELALYAPEELVGLPIAALFSEAERARAPLRYDLLDRGEKVITQRLLRRKDGSELPIEMHTRKLPEGGYMTFIRDISHRA